MTCYSKGTDDAWWMSDLFRLLMLKHGHRGAVRFETSTDGKVWQSVAPHDAIPEEPLF